MIKNRLLIQYLTQLEVVIWSCFKFSFGRSVALDLKPFCLKQQIKVHTKSNRQI